MLLCWLPSAFCPSGSAGECQCYETCDDDLFKHGQGFAGTNFYCYVPPSGAKAGTACAGPYAGGAKATCIGKVRKGFRVGITSTTYKCCCNDQYPNPLYYDGVLRGCAGLGE